jgi:hypothetical protein
MSIRLVGQAVLFTAVLAALLTGCSENKTAMVTGTVTVDGQDVEKGSISLIPADGKGSTSGGDIANGKYTVSGASVGQMKVQIRVPKVTGKKKMYDTPDSPYRETYGEVLPEKYNDNTDLRLEVKPGKNEKNWELTTK